jgi:hypothetical protein
VISFSARAEEAAHERRHPLPILPHCRSVICRERAGAGWLAIASGHGWLFGSVIEARAEARWLACNLGLPTREVAA